MISVSLPVPVRTLVDPVDGVAAVVQGRRWVAPLLVVVACVTLSALAVFARWDGSSRVVAEVSATGEISRMTEQELNERIATAERVRLVVGVARGLFLFPLFALGIAVALKFTGWLIGARAGFAQCMSAAAVALLPLGLYHLVQAFVVFNQPVVMEAQLDALVPSSLQAFFPKVAPKLGRVLGAVDFFNLWSAGLLGLGFSAASGVGKGRGVLLGYVLYALFAAAVLIGLPGLEGGRK